MTLHYVDNPCPSRGSLTGGGGGGGRAWGQQYSLLTVD